LKKRKGRGEKIIMMTTIPSRTYRENGKSPGKKKGKKRGEKSRGLADTAVIRTMKKKKREKRKQGMGVGEKEKKSAADRFSKEWAQKESRYSKIKILVKNQL